MIFAEKIQYLRKSRKLSQEQLAEIMNVSRQAVSKWESGQSYPDIDKLVDISSYFGVSIDSLIKDNYECVGHQYEETEIRNNSSRHISDSNKTILSLLVIVAIIVNIMSIITIHAAQNPGEALLRIVIAIICIYICVYRFKSLYSMKK